MFSGVVSWCLWPPGSPRRQSLFYDLSGLAGDTAAYPAGVNGAGQVSLVGYFGTSNYYHQYLYTGGTAGTMDNINSSFTTGKTFSNAINGSGQMAVNGVVKAWLYSGGTGGTVTKSSTAATTRTLPASIAPEMWAGATVSGVFRRTYTPAALCIS